MPKLHIEYFTGAPLEIDVDKIVQYDYLPIKNSGAQGISLTSLDVEPHQRTKSLAPLEYVLQCAVNHRPIILRNGDGFGKLVSLSLNHIKEIRQVDDLETKTSQ